MKVVVEWGKPKAACKNRPCGVSGSFVAMTKKQALLLAPQLFFTLTDGQESSTKKDAWAVSALEPRKVVWSKDRDVWVCVSLLDGVHRGSYAAYADKEAEYPGYAVCPMCHAAAGNPHRLACPNGPGQVEGSFDNVPKEFA